MQGFLISKYVHRTRCNEPEPDGARRVPDDSYSVMATPSSGTSDDDKFRRGAIVAVITDELFEFEDHLRTVDNYTEYSGLRLP